MKFSTKGKIILHNINPNKEISDFVNHLATGIKVGRVRESSVQDNIVNFKGDPIAIKGPRNMGFIDNGSIELRLLENKIIVNYNVEYTKHIKAYMIISLSIFILAFFIKGLNFALLSALFVIVSCLVIFIFNYLLFLIIFPIRIKEAINSQNEKNDDTFLMIAKILFNMSIKLFKRIKKKLTKR